MPVAVDWFQRNAKKDNWFLHINIWDPHTPYRVPAAYGEPFKNDPIPKWLDDEALIQRHGKLPGPHTILDISMYSDRENPQFPRQPGKVTDRAGMRKLMDGYDTGIRYADDQVGVMIDMLKQAGVYEDTAIIISSDHGENFGELGIYAEHATADEITCRIPFIVKWPGGARSAVANGFHYNLDWGPTLMELLKGQCPTVWQGESFASTILTGKDQGREQLVLSQCAHVCQRSVRWSHWLYMRTYHCGLHGFPAEMVFDIGADPHEQNNLAVERPDICREGAWRLANWHEEQMQYMTRHTTNIADPLWTVMSEGGPFHYREGNIPAYLKRLEATGRGEAAAQLRAKYAADLPK